MTFSIVVARYQENTNWSKSFPNVTIYNKGTPMHNEQNVVPLPNVGREGHTYYKYICDHYDDLPDYVAFLQGNPFDHSPNILDDLEKGFGKGKIDTPFKFLSDRVLNCNLNGCKYHSGLPLKEVYQKLFGQNKEDLAFDFGAGAQFIVSKTNILRHPRSFYSSIVDMLSHHVNPIEGFVIERFHKLIFVNEEPTS